MRILPWFGKKDKESTKMDPQGGTTGKMKAVHCDHSGLLVEDLMDLQILAAGKFLSRAWAACLFSRVIIPLLN